MSDEEDEDEVGGVGLFSVLTQESTNVDNTVGVKRRSGSYEELPVTFDQAMHESGTGIYQKILLLVCGLVNMACAISVTAVSFVIPAAQNDFKLNSFTIGLLNGAPFFGMLLGAYFWGIWGDTKGRRIVILASMAMDTLCAILSCLTQYVEVFFILRVGNGFANIGGCCMIYVYLGEFITPKKRDSYLLCLEVFWILGMIAGPGVAMVVIPSNIILLSYPHLKINAWRIFLFLTSLPSLISFILIYQYPETPRYLMLRGRLLKSRDILEQIYLANHKSTSEPYPVESFTQTFSAVAFEAIVPTNLPLITNLKTKLTVLKNGHLTLFSNHCKNITVTCVIEFCLMASYSAVLVWVPELFSRYYEFSALNKNDANLCTASDWLLKQQTNSSSMDIVSSRAYLAALIVAVSALLPTILTGILVKYINKKILLFLSCGVPFIAIILITITKNDFQAKIMCCIFEGFTTITEPILFCTMVELYPSNVRGVAFSMAVTIGRFGAVFGIIVFGILIDQNCLMSFYLLACLLFITFTAMMFLPKLKIGGHH